MRRLLLTVLVCVSMLVGCGGMAPPAGQRASTLSPKVSESKEAEPNKARALPVATPRGNTVDTYHGQNVRDPYRWLEEDSKRVSRWTDAQNAHAKKILGSIAGRSSVRASIEDLLSVGQLGAPEPRRTPWGAWRYYYLKREGLQNQPILYVREGLSGTDRVVFDVNALSADGTAAVDWFYPSPYGKKIAYGVSHNGDEQSTLFVREISRTGDVRELKDQIPRTRHCSLAWKPNAKGFYYTRYPNKGEVPEGEEFYHRAVFEHTLGTDSSHDHKIFGEGREMTDSPSVALSPNGRWLTVSVFQGWSKTELYVKDTLRPKSQFVPVAVGKEANYYPIPTNDAIFVETNDAAPRGKLIRVDPRKPERENWKIIIPEGDHTLNDVELVGNELITTYLRDASSMLQRYSLEGKLLGDIELPLLGTAVVRGAVNGREVFVGFSSFAVKSNVYRVALDGKVRRELWQRIKTPVALEKVVVSQQFAVSKDGTRVPYFVVRSADVALDGKAPVVMAAYGGFNIPIIPRFLGGAGVLLERGAVFVQANLRGGGEYGEAWHKAGMRERKQNVFDDMIAVAEDVKKKKIGDGDRMGVTGGSNGGLLVGAMVVQRPALFRVAVARVPLMDMLRYQHFLIAKLWIPEYGASDSVEVYPALRAYSPYHNVRDQVSYPAVMLTAAESDSRVHPFHARKMTAALQWATSSGEPILARIETKAGHGAGKPIAKRVEEFTDVYSFVMWKLGMLE